MRKERKRYQKRKLEKSPKRERMLRNISHWDEESAVLTHFTLTSNEWKKTQTYYTHTHTHTHIYIYIYIYIAN